MVGCVNQVFTRLTADEKLGDPNVAACLVNCLFFFLKGSSFWHSIFTAPAPVCYIARIEESDLSWREGHRGFAGAQHIPATNEAVERQSRLFLKVKGGLGLFFSTKRQSGLEVLVRLMHQGQIPEKEEPLGHHGAMS
jgi:hypothetical protein